MFSHTSEKVVLILGKERLELPNAKISVSNSTTIIKRTINKPKDFGEIIERWGKNSSSINITGEIVKYNVAPNSSLSARTPFTGDNKGVSLINYPNKEVALLMKFLESKQALKIESEATFALNISFIAIEGYDLPYTEGMSNQMYSIRGWSDYLKEEELEID